MAHKKKKTKSKYISGIRQTRKENRKKILQINVLELTAIGM